MIERPVFLYKQHVLYWLMVESTLLKNTLVSGHHEIVWFLWNSMEYLLTDLWCVGIVATWTSAIFNAKDMCEWGISIIPCVGLRITPQTECGLYVPLRKVRDVKWFQWWQVSVHSIITKLNNTLFTSASHDTATRSGIAPQVCLKPR